MREHDIVPDAGNLELVREALICLHNQIRVRAAGSARWPRTARSPRPPPATRRTWSRRDYFEHDTPEGGTFVDRIIAARYARSQRGWNLGENLVWGTGDLSTPAALDELLETRPATARTSSRASTRARAGHCLGTPTGAAYGVTVAAEFGARIR